MGREWRGEEEAAEAGKPERQSERIHGQNLLAQEAQSISRVSVSIGIAAPEFQRRPAIERVPEDIWYQKDECDRAAEPGPFACQVLALRGQQQTHDNSEAKHQYRK